MNVIPERIQTIRARIHPRLLLTPLCLTLASGIAIALALAQHLLEKPPHRPTPRDDLRMRVMERLAAPGQTMRRETLRARAEGEEPHAARARIVQRKAGQDGVLSGLRRAAGLGQRGVLRKRGGHDRVFDRRRDGGLRRLLLLLHG
jgi:hypothetical protein